MIKRLFSSLHLLRRHRSLFVAALTIACVGIVGQVSAAEPAPGAVLSIPAINVSAAVVTIPLDQSIGTWNTNSLGMDVGHFEYTPWLGESGNIVIGGHSTDDEGRPSVFYNLDDLRTGDRFTLTEGGTTVEYVVTGIRSVPISDLTVLYPTGRDIVTLITCAGFNRQTRAYERRLAVTAERAG